MLGNNMFGYCVNCPITMADPTGQSACILVRKDKSCIDEGYGSAVCGAVSLFVGIEIADTIDGLADSFERWLDEQQRAVSKQLNKSLARIELKPRRESYHTHHIVPQNDIRGLPAQIVIQEVFPNLGVNDPRNLVSVSSRIHSHLHTNLYYALVNNTITLAYLAAGDSAVQKEMSVSTALYGLRVFIVSLELL